MKKSKNVSGKRVFLVATSDYDTRIRPKDHERAMLAALTFKDADGKKMPPPYPGIGTSPEFGPFVYLRGASSDRSKSMVWLPIPAGAARLEVEVHPFRAAGIQPVDLEFVRAWQTVIPMLEEADLEQREANVLRDRIVQSASADPEATHEHLKDFSRMQFRSLPLRDVILGQYLDLRVRRGEIDGLVAEADRFLADGELPTVRALRGSVAYLEGRMEEAYSDFMKAAQGALPRMMLGANFVRPFKDFGAWSSEPRIWTRELEFRSLPEKGRPLCLFGADPRYFCNFAEDAVASLRRTGSAYQAHFHVVGWTDECTEVAGRLDASISVEPEIDDRGWFATARFYHLATILDLVEADVLVADIDIDFRSEPDSLPRNDVSMRRCAVHHAPWYDPSAGSVLIRNSPNGKRFADELRAYIGARFAPVYPRNWWFDQLALNEVMRFLDDIEYGRHNNIVPRSDVDLASRKFGRN